VRHTLQNQINSVVTVFYDAPVWRNRTGRTDRRTRDTFMCVYIGKGKGKAVPLQACSGPEGSRKLRFPDFMTTAQDGGKVVSLTH